MVHVIDVNDSPWRRWPDLTSPVGRGVAFAVAGISRAQRSRGNGRDRRLFALNNRDLLRHRGCMYSRSIRTFDYVGSRLLLLLLLLMVVLLMVLMFVLLCARRHLFERL